MLIDYPICLLEYSKSDFCGKIAQWRLGTAGKTDLNKINDE